MTTDVPIHCTFTKLVSIDELKPHPLNANRHPESQIAVFAEIVRGNGIRRAVTVSKLSGCIVAGHGLVQTLKAIGVSRVPVDFQDFADEAHELAHLAADNRLAELGEMDNAALVRIIQEIEARGGDLDLTGFNPEALDVLLAEATPEGLTDENETPEIPAAPVAVVGDVWECGLHRVMCGDSTNAEQVRRLVGGRKADLWITDPPYNVAYEGGTSEKLTIQNDDMSDEDFRQFLRDVYSAADAVMKPGAVFYIWHADSEGYNFRGAAVDVGWKVRQCLVWNKNTFVMGRQDYQWKHEPCLYGWKEGASHFWGSDRSQTTVLEFDKPSRNGEHPTMKPVALFAYQIGNSSKANSIVLDSFGGSGTTLIACEQLGRRARLMELDPRYCDVIVTRWQNFTGKHALHEGSGRTFEEVKVERQTATKNNTTEQT